MEAKTYFFITFVGLLINLILNLIFILILKINVEAILYSYTISALFIIVSGMVLTGKYFKVKINFKKVKELVIYGNKFIYYGLFLLIIESTFILNVFLTLCLDKLIVTKS